MGQRYENEFSDYGSGNTSDSSTMSWGGHEQWPQSDLRDAMRPNKQKSSSYADLVTGRCTIDDVMQEFKMNGFDSPYTPEDDASSNQRHAEEALGTSGMGPSSAYLRQKSWPEPERTPVARLPPRWLESQPTATTSAGAGAGAGAWSLSAAQRRVLGALLDQLQQLTVTQPPPQDRAMRECRFCKNNGERESYYRSHSLKGAGGRVSCPVLRAFRCRRCGASGDHAHTIKYCPLATSEERMKSAAMMRSVRLASGRRRASPPEYVMFGETPPSLQDSIYNYGADMAAPLDPLWAALEQKLML